ncbi:hypothetical protein N7493_003553 [Penicillium malachiteum]|uniref:Uncharacterized protein n=1 Tax=Penicillium malachiteum TaxID=1324776 RepID=A0AAD6HQE5_9EURO|nr:hypothetical protein N7493_003553 [Penicillium malachiteum]
MVLFIKDKDPTLDGKETGHKFDESLIYTLSPKGCRVSGSYTEYNTGTYIIGLDELYHHEHNYNEDNEVSYFPDPGDKNDEPRRDGSH